MSAIFTSLIQSSFRSNGHGNLEAVIQLGDRLLHFWRDNSDDKLWRLGPGGKGAGKGVICDANVAGAGSIIQSDFKRGDHGNFEVVVPLKMNNNRLQIWHFFHDNSNVEKRWEKSPHPVTGDDHHVVGPASIIQSDFKQGDHGNFEVVVPLMGPKGHAELWHFSHDNSNVENEWRRLKRITGESDQVVHAGAIIQSNLKQGEHGNFEVVVPLVGPHGHTELWHFFRDNSNGDREWVKVRRITGEWDQVAGPGVIIQSDFAEDKYGNFEVVVPLKMPNGHTELCHFWHDNADIRNEWQRGQMITASASGWACITSSDFGAGKHRDFEVLVEECQQSVVHYWHHNENRTFPWLRGKPIIIEKSVEQLHKTHKIVQLTGEFDREGWDGEL